MGNILYIEEVTIYRSIFLYIEILYIVYFYIYNSSYYSSYYRNSTIRYKRSE